MKLINESDGELVYSTESPIGYRSKNTTRMAGLNITAASADIF